ncbi:glycosyltransferase family 2 protein [Phocaeicola plebeius]|uniref:glycosyltransferase family 2 protein n=1 Tax=Phocaeicola plebeius TaxID=310297 RepID=UPI0026EFA3EB|nr:glycosyltransferase family 2 protein [Phocaeicola plebeius]
MRPLITIIVPIYKVEQYLKTCLNSIIQQTYTKLEILLIDDGSPDGCGKICDEYAQKDSRIKVIHKNNEGLSAARNEGINIAKGEYITFIDSDDFINKKYINYLYELIEHYNADISVCSYKKFDTYTENNIVKVSEINSKPTIQIYSGKEAVIKSLYQKDIDNSAWGKLYSKKLFANLRFKQGIIYEDLEISHKIYSIAQKVVNSNKKLYYYRQHSSSILGTKFNNKKLVVLDITDDILNQMKIQQDKQLIKAAESRKLSANFNILGLIPKEHETYISTSSRCWNNIKQLRLRCFFDKNVRIKNKIGIIISIFGFYITRICLWHSYNKKQ